MMTDILPGRLSLHEQKSMIAQRSLVCSMPTYCVTLIAPPRTRSSSLDLASCGLARPDQLFEFSTRHDGRRPG